MDSATEEANISIEKLVRKLQQRPTIEYAERVQVVTTLYNRMIGPLTRYSLRHFPSQSDAEGHAHDCLTDALTFKIDKFKDTGPDSFMAWMITVTKNAALNKLKKDKTKQTSSIEELQEEGQEIADTREGGGMTLDDFKSILIRAELSEEECTIAILYFWEELPPREIAVIMGIPAVQISRIIYRIRKRLKPWL